MKLSVIAVFAAFFICDCALGDNQKSYPDYVSLWPDGKIPFGQRILKFTPAQLAQNKTNVVYKYVDVPQYQLFKAEGGGDALAVVVPGGSYTWLCYEMEGVEVGEWLSKHSVNAMVLKYRVPDDCKGALQDIQRAIRLARANAAVWGVNPKKIFVMGFSAGGNLCTRASNFFDEQTYEPVDEADKFSARPDAAVLMYPAYLDMYWHNKRWGGKKIADNAPISEKYALAPNLKISGKIPPTYIFAISDDPYGGAAPAYFAALREAKVAASLYVVERGGHGGGLKCASFPNRLRLEMILDWLDGHGIINARQAK